MNLEGFFKIKNGRIFRVLWLAAFCVLAFSLAPLSSVQATEYVDASATPGGGGSSWATAHTNIQDAINSAFAGEEIWVKQGTYNLTTQINVNQAVSIYGGFPIAIAVPVWGDRDWDTNVTTVDGQDLVHHVFYTSADSRIDGFTITGGNAGFALPLPVAHDDKGGGIHIRQPDATIVNCTFTQNSATDQGGAIFIYDSNSTIITNCTFAENDADIGAGVADILSNVTITNSLFINNVAVAHGGGLSNDGSYSVTVSNCTFYGNNSTDSASAGGGIYNAHTDTTIDNCIVWGNSADVGPQIYNQQTFPESNTVNLTVDYVALSTRLYPALSGVGGSLYNGDTLWITNGTTTESRLVDELVDVAIALTSDYTTGTTLNVGSTAGIETGVRIWISDGANTESALVTATTATTITVATAFSNTYTVAALSEVSTLCIDLQSGFTNPYLMANTYIYTELPLTVTYSDVQDGNWDNRAPVWLNNIDVDPNFVSIATNDYHLDVGSPAIDAGDNLAVNPDTADIDGDGNMAELTPFDLDDDGRFFDDTATVDTGNGTAPITDMGAYEYEPDFTVTFVDDGNGSITGTNPQTVNNGDNCTAVTAVENTGYHFVNWTGTGGFVTTTDNPLTVTNVTADMTITANFAIDQHTVTFATGANGGITGTSPQTVDYGSSCTAITATADANYHFVNWTGTGGFVTTTDNPLTVTNVTADMTITANFAIDQHTVTFANDGNGSVTGTNPQTVDYGDNCTAVTAVENTGYHFVNWTGTGGFVTTTDNPLTVTNVTADMTITANFAIDQHTVTFATGANGGITGTSPQTVDYGSSCTAITATADANYHFVNWTGTGGFVTTTDNPLTVTNVTADMTITANFAINQYTVTFAAGANGSVTGTSPQTVNHGSNCTAVNAVANANYHFVNWTGTGGFVTTTANPLTVANVTSDMTITANFVIDQYTVTFAAGANGGFTGTSPQTIDHGSDCTAVTAVPDATYRLLNWTGTGGFVSIDDPLTVTNVTSDMTITANFTRDEYTVIFLADTNGSVSGTSPQTVLNGTDCSTVTASALPNYHFVNWTGTGGFVTTTDNPLTVTNVTSSMTITANFAIDQHTLTMAAVGTGPGTITPTAGGHIYDYGTVVDLIAVPGANSAFDGWTGDVADTDSAMTTVTMDSDKTVTATFNSDGDSDGISDIEEDGAPNGGDGNGDGTDDSLQNNVTSLLTQDGLDYVTIESAPGTILSNVRALENPSPSDSPSGLDFAQEFFDFTITGFGPGPGAGTTVTLYCPAGTSPTTYYRYGPTPADGTDHWYEFMYDGTTGAEINANVITLHFVDGDRGDDDLDDTNNTIVDAGGPGSASASGGGGGGGGSSGGGCFIATTALGSPNISVVSMIPYLALMLLLFVIGKATQGRRKR